MIITSSPATPSLADFDHQSGSFVERLLFNNRRIVVLLCLLFTAVL